MDDLLLHVARTVALRRATGWPSTYDQLNS